MKQSSPVLASSLVFSQRAPGEQFMLQRREEALAPRVVVGIAEQTHRRTRTGLFSAFAECERGVLAAVIGMMDDDLETVLFDRHRQSAHHAIGVVRLLSSA